MVVVVGKGDSYTVVAVSQMHTIWYFLKNIYVCKIVYLFLSGYWLIPARIAESNHTNSEIVLMIFYLSLKVLCYSCWYKLMKYLTIIQAVSGIIIS